MLWLLALAAECASYLAASLASSPVPGGVCPSTVLQSLREGVRTCPPADDGLRSWSALVADSPDVAELGFDVWRAGDGGAWKMR
eukprot:CAMPEP_0185558478 /NCGR_PEP_ID=MMETSP1381-20130426/52382_1 /TAXON_ID=298111 /ORGANISM="Pavlova sp., Strain CCMP459" /LENGTH=83 /DNA_ID=CAMNT_0028172029 /DNA_START=244 /DNA_END=493 /DNA_ORIENTATION=-